MKKIFLLALTFALIWVCASALAENRLTLPASTKTIEAEAFMNNIAITEVVIPEGCVSIGENAFAGCVNITTVYMPESVQNIEENAFANCDKLQILLERGSYAQEWCKSNDISYTDNVIATPGLTYRLERGNAIITGVSERDVIDLVIPSSIDGYQVTAIDHNAFSGRNDIQGNLFIANGIKSIGYLAFAGCTGLVGDLYFPDSILEIGYFAFESCSGFDGSLILPMNLSSLGYGAFSKCSGFSGVLTIPHNIQAIYECTFWGCTGFSGNLIIPENVTIIGREAFCGCSGFTGELIISDSVTSIAIGAFQNCSGFSSVQIGKSVTSIGSIAFSGLSAVHGDLVIPNSVLSIGSSAFSWSGWDGKLTLSENLSSISEGAFKGVQFSGILQIPANTKSIETDAFFNCTHLEAVVFEEGLERIAGGAFRDCTGLSGNIVFPDSLRIIETHGGYDNYGAFVGCTGITGVQFGKSMESIGTAAFSSCNSLQTIIWGESIKNISNNAFWNCSEINMEFYLPAAIETIGSGAFLGCSKLYGNLAIPNSVTFIGQDAFKNCTGLNGYLTISEQLTSISWGAFENCSGLHGDLIIPDSVTQIHDFAFAGCTGFTSLTLSQNLTYLSGGVFYNCTGLTGNLILPSTLTKIDASYRGWFGVYHAGTFENCTGFGGNLIIPDSVEIIEMNAFKGCSGFDGNLTMGDEVRTIGEYAFGGCNNLKSIEHISASLCSFGRGAFYGCPSLKGTIVVPDVSGRLEAFEQYKEAIVLTIDQYDERCRLEKLLMLHMIDGILTISDNLKIERQEMSPAELLLVHIPIDTLEGSLSDDLNPLKKKQYLFDQALSYLKEEQEVQMVNYNLIPDYVKNINTWYEHESNDYLLAVSAMAFPNMPTDISIIDLSTVKEMFESYRKSSINDHGESELRNIEKKLKETELTDNQVTSVLYAMVFMRDLSFIQNVVKQYGRVETYANNIIGVWNKLQILKSLDNVQLLKVSRVYSSSDDEAMQEVGRMLQELANSTYEERIILVYTEKLVEWGIDQCIDQLANYVINKVAESNVLVAATKLIWSEIEWISGVGSIPNLRKHLFYDYNASVDAYLTTVYDINYYISKQNDGTFDQAYWSYITFCELMIQTQEDAIRLIQYDPNSLVGALVAWTNQEKVEYSQFVISKLQEYINICKSLYSLRNSDVEEYNANVEQLIDTSDS